MTVNYTSLLGLALPVTGTEAGAWGDVVNNYLTSYLDASVAGTQTITGSQTAVTLAVTNGATLVTVGSGATGSAQFQIITCTGNPASLLTITAPASSRQYIIINSTSTSQSVKIVGAGPTTGVTIVSGEKAHVAWNGSDFVKIATQSGNGSFVDLTVSGNLTLSGGTQNGVLYLNASKVATSGSALTFDGTNLFVGTSTNTNSSRIVSAGTISETVSSTQYLVASQFDIGTAANEIPLNQYLGNLAYQDAGSIAGQVGLSAGTAALPSLVSATDTDTGMWFPAANTLAWSTGGTERARITSGGTFETSLDASIYGVTVGRGAGAVASNTAVGASALAANTTGNGATAIGASALAGVNISAYATAVGYNALNANTSGEANAGFGAYSLFKTTSGAYNTGAGVGALQNNITGANNTAVGYTALINNTASSNTAVGHQAGYSNETGTYLTLVGYQAGFSNTVNSPQTSIGYQAGYFQTGTVVALGYRAAYGASGTSTGNFNTAIGDLALQANTTASNNTAVGYQAGYGNTTGDTIAAFGFWALKSNTTGRNTGIGPYALATNTTGTNNNAFGDSALYLNTTGNYNTAVGYTALLYNTTASFNTAVGYEALYNSDPALTNATSLTSGNNGTVYTIISVGSTDFTAIGAASNTAGITFTKSGGTGTGTGTVKQNVNALNTAIGYRSGYAITTGTKNTILGAYNGNQGGLDIRTASNYIVLSDGDGNPRGYFDTAGVFNTGTLRAIGTAVGSFTASNWFIQQEDGSTTRSYAVGPDTSTYARWEHYTAKSNGTPVLTQRWNADANIAVNNIGLGFATPTTSGTGITFPATQSASSDANTLDDYEEGTHTTTVSCGTSGTVTLKTAENSLQYTKIGRQVTVVGLVTVDSVSSPVGYFTMSLPFPIGNHGEYSSRPSGAVTMSGVASANISDFVVLGVEGEGSLRIYLGDGTGIQPDAAEQLQANTSVYITFTYFI